MLQLKFKILERTHLVSARQSWPFAVLFEIVTSLFLTYLKVAIIPYFVETVGQLREQVAAQCFSKPLQDAFKRALSVPSHLSQLLAGVALKATTKNAFKSSDKFLFTRCGPAAFPLLEYFLFVSLLIISVRTFLPLYLGIQFLNSFLLVVLVLSLGAL